MTKFFAVLLSLLLCSTLIGGAEAAATDRALLSQFCAPKAIAGATCKEAKSYPEAEGRRCNVTLQPHRQQGRFLAGAKPLLLVSYGSDCEAHVNNFGGVVAFEQVGGSAKFLGFLPGMGVNDCVIAAKDGAQDVLVCLTGGMFQGVVESGIARVRFPSGSGGSFNMSYDFLLQAEDTTGAYTSYVVTCSEQFKYFGLSKLALGPRPGTVIAKVDYADRATIEKACAKDFPIPKDAEDHKLSEGEAYVPAPNAKRGSVLIDISTRTVTLR
ncbi:hypothetical protein SSBR45G_39450 [Bradyrhizobium sp. SSBR45G]|uniref:hypothetical protein n=1 Tax=unclassified Bradyrhizobium TaxID=2631580 RepID=UPI0023429205|nr:MULTISPECIES: hypothetical protein [unclassified Bradyrhizobium]GLH79036.1 hypothetical protein SSBR45G_39450 [Bradyrhizobium sp. SSBR45G]GLH86640.1 hypothetical protein SSBR45R_41000 [Bradyrhizobium sp. SSBR45R]